ncbi:hypothetical protein M2338_002457 [Sphingobium sp. B2D3B]|nr:hypothetical protein [Sphingobium sp. B2D3B]MCW2396935.1 hypothetical protein [Sphingobium sp. B2D3C]
MYQLEVIQLEASAMSVKPLSQNAAVALPSETAIKTDRQPVSKIFLN